MFVLWHIARFTAFQFVIIKGGHFISKQTALGQMLAHFVRWNSSILCRTDVRQWINCRLLRQQNWRQFSCHDLTIGMYWQTMVWRVMLCVAWCLNGRALDVRFAGHVT